MHQHGNRARRLARIVGTAIWEWLSQPGAGCWVVPPSPVFNDDDSAQPPEIPPENPQAMPRIDPAELDEWLASVLGEENR